MKASPLVLQFSMHFNLYHFIFTGIPCGFLRIPELHSNKTRRHSPVRSRYSNREHEAKQKKQELVHVTGQARHMNMKYEASRAMKIVQARQEATFPRKQKKATHTCGEPVSTNNRKNYEYRSNNNNKKVVCHQRRQYTHTHTERKGLSKSPSTAIIFHISCPQKCRVRLQLLSLFGSVHQRSFIYLGEEKRREGGGGVRKERHELGSPC